MIDFKKRQGESDEELIFRICSLKTTETWQEIADGLNKELNTEYTESKFRKQYQSFQRMFDSVKHKVVESKEHIQDIDTKIDELYKQQVKTRDVLREYRAGLRDEARIEVLVDAIHKAVEVQNPLVIDKKYDDGTSEAVLCLSDWHIGAEVSNFYNSYNLRIARERISKLVADTISYCKRNNVKKLNVISLGDLLEGNIHVTTRVQSEIDVIKQVMVCAELVSNLLNELNNNIECVTFRYVLDNHGRINTYKEHLEKENFGKLVYWYVEERMKSTSVEVFQNAIDENIGFFRLENGKTFFFEHGHLGVANAKFQEIAFATNIIPDYIAIGHFHHVATKEFQGKKMFACGTMKGADDYSLSKRLFSKPSQSLIIFDDSNEIRIDIGLE